MTEAVAPVSGRQTPNTLAGLCRHATPLHAGFDNENGIGKVTPPPSHVVSPRPPFRSARRSLLTELWPIN